MTISNGSLIHCANNQLQDQSLIVLFGGSMSIIDDPILLVLSIIDDSILMINDIIIDPTLLMLSIIIDPLLLMLSIHY